jgi:hypothetical protein
MASVITSGGGSMSPRWLEGGGILQQVGQVPQLQGFQEITSGFTDIIKRLKHHSLS